jgi:hypothetical protein
MCNIISAGYNFVYDDDDDDDDDDFFFFGVLRLAQTPEPGLKEVSHPKWQRCWNNGTGL